MCGIVGYVGNQEALPTLMSGLKALEYRGYDSAGVCVLERPGAALHVRAAGDVAALEGALARQASAGRAGIAHTRWATHGEPSETNAHPHADCNGRIFVVHNGIIENHTELKNYLRERGHQFRSDTDTEVIAHLIEDNLTDGRDFKTALVDALKMIRGAYALLVADACDPERLYAVRLSSPLVLGVGAGETLIASDPAALIEYTKDVVYLGDGEVAEVSQAGIQLTDLAQQPTPFAVVRLEWSLEQARKGDFAHYMLKEIYEGPDAVRATLRGRLKVAQGLVKLGGLETVHEELKAAKRLVILACGTSHYAGLIGEYLFEEIAGIPTEVHVASEFRYRNTPIEPGTVALAISQSGETADTLAALRHAKAQGALTLGLVNVVGSSIARETDAGVYNHAGPEIAVASSKAFMSQVTALSLVALSLATDEQKKQQLIAELARIPQKIEAILKQAPHIQAVAEKYHDFEHALFIGRRLSHPVALEGALKLKEISYIHAEGYSAGEMKHGPIAMICSEFPTVAIVPHNSVAEKMHGNIEEIRARRGPVLAIATEGDARVGALANDVISIPATEELLEPLLTVVPLQIFAYYMGVQRGYNVDRPRNLAKSVTVE